MDYADPSLPQTTTWVRWDTRLFLTAEYKEAFALFDKRGTGQVPRESLGELLRSLGQNPTQAEVSQLESDIGATCGCFCRSTDSSRL